MLPPPAIYPSPLHITKKADRLSRSPQPKEVADHNDSSLIAPSWDGNSFREEYIAGDSNGSRTPITGGRKNACLSSTKLYAGSVPILRQKLGPISMEQDETNHPYAPSCCQASNRQEPRLMPSLDPFSTVKKSSITSSGLPGNLHSEHGVSGSGGSSNLCSNPSNSSRAETRGPSSPTSSKTPYDAIFPDRRSRENSVENPCSSRSFIGGESTDPYMLIPHITITSQAKLLAGGRCGIWTAIEICGHLSNPSPNSADLDGLKSTEGSLRSLAVRHDPSDVSRYGYLHDVQIDIQALGEGCVVEIVDDPKRKICPGTSTLTLANIQVETPGRSQKESEALLGDEDLFAEVESQLGSSRVEFALVRVKYRHSGFQSLRESPPCGNGVLFCDTWLETVAMGVTDLPGLGLTESFPDGTSSPSWNPLFPIIAAHWGPIRANGLLTKKIMPSFQASIPPRCSMDVKHFAKPNSAPLASLQKGKSPSRPKPFVTKRPGTAIPMPSIPQRQASLTQKPLRPKTTTASDEKEEIDPARKIWTRIRKASSSNESTRSSMGHEPMSSGKTAYSGRHEEKSLMNSQSGKHHTFHGLADCTNTRVSDAVQCDSDDDYLSLRGNMGFQASEVMHRRQHLRNKALRNKRSIRADSLRSLVPSVAEGDFDRQESMGSSRRFSDFYDGGIFTPTAAASRHGHHGLGGIENNRNAMLMQSQTTRESKTNSR